MSSVWEHYQLCVGGEQRPGQKRPYKWPANPLTEIVHGRARTPSRQTWRVALNEVWERVSKRERERENFIDNQIDD